MKKQEREELLGALATVVFQHTLPVGKKTSAIDSSFAVANRIMEILSEYVPTTEGALLPRYPKDEGHSDYILTGHSCWVEVGEIAAYIKNDGDGINIELFPNYPGAGDGSPLAELAYGFEDVPDEEEDDEA
jgi:hypothetical protein